MARGRDIESQHSYGILARGRDIESQHSYGIITAQKYALAYFLGIKMHTCTMTKPLFAEFC